MRILLTGIVNTDISDHFPVFLITEPEVNETRKSNFIFKREINNVNFRKFNEALLNVKWTIVLRSTDPNTAYNEFLKEFSHTL